MVCLYKLFTQHFLTLVIRLSLALRSWEGTYHEELFSAFRERGKSEGTLPPPS